MKKHRYFLLPFLAAALVCFSCASVTRPEEKTKEPANLEAPISFLPMRAGWYLYNSERAWKSIEDEYNFFESTGMKMVLETTWKYTGVVCRFEDGVLYDPISKVELSIDGEGGISCAGNVSIRGNMDKDGRLFWSGINKEHEKMQSIFVKGTLIPVPPSARGGREFDGVYHLRNVVTEREMLVNVSDGFSTYTYLDTEDDSSPWPVLIMSDGSFSYSIEITTLVEMGDLAANKLSTLFSSTGQVIPGQGINLEETTRTAGQVDDQAGAPQAYAGTYIRSGEFPNEAIPADIESLIRSGRAALRAEPKPNPADYPSWYLRPPKKQGYILATGEKTFNDREAAFALAEAAAAADLAEQLWAKIESTILDTSMGNETLTDERIKSETMQRMNYRVIERTYNEETHTAFVLAETAVD